MSRYSDQFKDSVTGPIAGASVYVYRQDTGALATLTSDGSTSLANPVTTDSYGNFAFYTADGLYDLRFIVGGKAVYQEDGVLVGVSPFIVTSATGQMVGTRSLLAAIVSPVNGQAADLTETGRDGRFVFSTANNSANVTADPAQAIYVAPASDTTGASGAWVRRYKAGEINLSWFGTVGDDTTDDTTAVQRSLTYLCSTMKGGVLIVPFARYKVTNLVLPAYDLSSGNALRTIGLRGVAMPATEFGSTLTFPVATTGAIFRSTATTGGSLLGVAAGGGFGGFSWYHVVLENLNFRTYDNPQISAVDMSNASQLTAHNLQIDTNVYSVLAARPTTTTSSGLITPKNDNAALIHLRNISISGYYNLLQVNEHTDADGINLGSGWYGLLFNTANHASRIGRVLAQRVNTPVAFAGAHRFSIEQLDIEHSISAAEATNPADLTVGNGYQVTQEDFRDITNGARGFVNWHVVRGYGVSPGPDDTFTINGAAHVQFRQLGEAVPTISTVVQPSTQSIPNATTTSVSFQNSGTAEAGIAMNAGDNTQIVFARQGTYRVTVRVAFASNSTGYRQVYFELNGTGIATDAKNAINGAATWLTVTTVVGIAAAGVLKVKAIQNSGGALNLVAASDAGVVEVEKLRDQAL